MNSQGTNSQDTNIDVLTQSGAVIENVVIDSSVSYEFREKVAALQEAILTLHPTMPVLLRAIHTHLRKDPEIVTLLSEDEIGSIVNGLKIQTKTELITAPAKATKSDAGLKKAIKSAGGSAADLF